MIPVKKFIIPRDAKNIPMKCAKSCLIKVNTTVPMQIKVALARPQVPYAKNPPSLGP